MEFHYVYAAILFLSIHWKKNKYRLDFNTDFRDFLFVQLMMTCPRLALATADWPLPQPSFIQNLVPHNCIQRRWCRNFSWVSLILGDSNVFQIYKNITLYWTTGLKELWEYFHCILFLWKSYEFWVPFSSLYSILCFLFISFSLIVQFFSFYYLN